MAAAIYPKASSALDTIASSLVLASLLPLAVFAVLSFASRPPPRRRAKRTPTAVRPSKTPPRHLRLRPPSPYRLPREEHISVPARKKLTPYPLLVIAALLLGTYGSLSASSAVSFVRSSSNASDASMPSPAAWMSTYKAAEAVGWIGWAFLILYLWILVGVEPFFQRRRRRRPARVRRSSVVEVGLQHRSESGKAILARCALVKVLAIGVLGTSLAIVVATASSGSSDFTSSSTDLRSLRTVSASFLFAFELCIAVSACFLSTDSDGVGGPSGEDVVVAREREGKTEQRWSGGDLEMRHAGRVTKDLEPGRDDQSSSLDRPDTDVRNLRQRLGHLAVRLVIAQLIACVSACLLLANVSRRSSSIELGTSVLTVLRMMFLLLDVGDRNFAFVARSFEIRSVRRHARPDYATPPSSPPPPRHPNGPPISPPASPSRGRVVSRPMRRLGPRPSDRHSQNLGLDIRHEPDNQPEQQQRKVTATRASTLSRYAWPDEASRPSRERFERSGPVSRRTTGTYRRRRDALDFGAAAQHNSDLDPGDYQDRVVPAWLESVACASTEAVAGRSSAPPRIMASRSPSVGGTGASTPVAVAGSTRPGSIVQRERSELRLSSTTDREVLAALELADGETGSMSVEERSTVAGGPLCSRQASDSDDSAIVRLCRQLSTDAFASAAPSSQGYVDWPPRSVLDGDVDERSDGSQSGVVTPSITPSGRSVGWWKSTSSGRGSNGRSGSASPTRFRPRFSPVPATPPPCVGPGQAGSSSSLGASKVGTASRGSTSSSPSLSRIQSAVSSSILRPSQHLLRTATAAIASSASAAAAPRPSDESFVCAGEDSVEGCRPGAASLEQQLSELQKAERHGYVPADRIVLGGRTPGPGGSAYEPLGRRITAEASSSTGRLASHRVPILHRYFEASKETGNSDQVAVPSVPGTTRRTATSTKTDERQAAHLANGDRPCGGARGDAEGAEVEDQRVRGPRAADRSKASPGGGDRPCPRRTKTGLPVVAVPAVAVAEDEARVPSSAECGVTTCRNANSLADSGSGTATEPTATATLGGTRATTTTTTAPRSKTPDSDEFDPFVLERTWPARRFPDFDVVAGRRVTPGRKGDRGGRR